MNSEYQALKGYGSRRLFAVWNEGSPFTPLFQKSAEHLLGGVSAPLVGMLESTLKIIRTFEQRGVVFQTEDGKPFDAVELLIEFQIAANTKNGEVMSECLSLVVHVLENLRSSLPPGTTLALNTNPEPVAQVAPTLVQVVSLPERVTTTAILRDSDGNITASNQIERDGVAA